MQKNSAIYVAFLWKTKLNNNGCDYIPSGVLEIYLSFQDCFSREENYYLFKILNVI